MKRLLVLLFFTLVYTFGIAQQEGVVFIDYECDTVFASTGQSQIAFDVDFDGEDDIMVNNYLGGPGFHETGLDFSVLEWSTGLMHLAYPWDQEQSFGHDTIQTGDTLQNSSSWLTSFSFGYSWDFIDPQVDGFKGYLGTRKKIGNSYYYGWIEFKMFWDTSLNIYIPVPRLILFKSAFCTIPDYPLRAGQTELAWSLEERQEQVEIYPNPAKGRVKTYGKDLKSAEIHNSLGQFVASTQGNGNQIEMDFSVLPAGVYFVKVTNKDGKCFVKKVIKQ